MARKMRSINLNLLYCSHVKTDPACGFILIIGGNVWETDRPTSKPRAPAIHFIGFNYYATNEFHGQIVTTI